MIGLLNCVLFIREGCLYDHNTYSLHGASLLEDLVITVADGISSIYLELISVDGEISDKVNSLGLRLCALTTRALQKMRNKVLHVFLDVNYYAFISQFQMFARPVLSLTLSYGKEKVPVGVWIRICGAKYGTIPRPQSSTLLTNL